jgi:hypothetical protein
MFDDDSKRDRERKVIRELEKQAISSVMRTETGRGFMFKCLQNCGTFSSSFSEDTHKHAYFAGMRSHGLWLDGELRSAAPEDYYKMLRENM